MRAPRVLIADDHPPTRAGVRAALQSGGFVVCGEAQTAAQAIALAAERRPDVVLLEVDLPGGGIVAAGEIEARGHAGAVVFLTASRDDRDLFAALRAGAAGYLLKDTAPERLPHAIRGVLAGEAAIPRDLVARLIEEFRHSGGRRRLHVPGRRAIALSPREWDVLDLLADGFSTAQLAERLHIAPVTVRRHVSELCAKLGAADRAEAVELLRASRAHRAA